MSEKQVMKLVNEIQEKKIEPPFLPYNLVHTYETLADYYGISKGARGLEKPVTSDKGFVRIYENASSPEKLEKIPVKISNPTGANWLQTRNNRVRAKLGQMLKMNIPFFHEEGPLKGFPTVMHTILIMWAFSPYPHIIKKINLKNLPKK